MKSTLDQLYLRQINEESNNDMKENFNGSIPNNSSLYSQIRTTLNRNTKQNSIISGENPICSNRFETLDPPIETKHHRSKSRQTSFQVNNTGTLKPTKILQHNSRNNNIIDRFSKAKTLFSAEFKINEANKTIDYSNRKMENEFNLKKAYQQFCKYKTIKAYLPSRKLSSNGVKCKKDYLFNTSQKNCKSSINNYLCYKNVNSNFQKGKNHCNLFPYKEKDSKKSSNKMGGKNNSELYDLVDILQQMNIDIESRLTQAKNEKKEKAEEIEETRLENHPKVIELKEKITKIKVQFSKENSNHENLIYINKDLKNQYNQILNEKKELIESNKKLNQKNQIQIKLLEEALTKRKLDYEKLEKRYHELKDFRKGNGDKEYKNYDDLFVGDTIKILNEKIHKVGLKEAQQIKQYLNRALDYYSNINMRKLSLLHESSNVLNKNSCLENSKNNFENIELFPERLNSYFASAEL